MDDKQRTGFALGAMFSSNGNIPQCFFPLRSVVEVTRSSVIIIEVGRMVALIGYMHGLPDHANLT